MSIIKHLLSCIVLLYSVSTNLHIFHFLPDLSSWLRCQSPFIIRLWCAVLWGNYSELLPGNISFLCLAAGCASWLRFPSESAERDDVLSPGRLNWVLLFSVRRCKQGQTTDGMLMWVLHETVTLMISGSAVLSTHLCSVASVHWRNTFCNTFFFFLLNLIGEPWGFC